MRREFIYRSLPNAVLAAVFIFVRVNAAFADGGRIRFRRPAGPFIVTLFTTPDPLTAGPVDFSVAVEQAGISGLVQDAHVDFILAPAEGHGHQLVFHASHSAATSKWLQAANFSIPVHGLWHVAVVVRRGRQVGQCSGEVLVKDDAARNLTWDILPVPLVALLFMLHQIRKGKCKRERRTSLSSCASDLHLS